MELNNYNRVQLCIENFLATGTISMKMLMLHQNCIKIVVRDFPILMFYSKICSRELFLLMYQSFWIAERSLKSVILNVTG